MYVFKQPLKNVLDLMILRNLDTNQKLLILGTQTRDTDTTHFRILNQTLVGMKDHITMDKLLFHILFEQHPQQTTGMVVQEISKT